MNFQGKTAMKNDLDLKWDKREQDFVEQSIHIHEQQVKKRDAEEYLNFLSGIGLENVTSPVPRIRDKQFVL
jgi:hypothetical protein